MSSLKSLTGEHSAEDAYGNTRRCRVVIELMVEIAKAGWIHGWIELQSGRVEGNYVEGGCARVPGGGRQQRCTQFVGIAVGSGGGLA